MNGLNKFTKLSCCGLLLLCCVSRTAKAAEETPAKAEPSSAAPDAAPAPAYSRIDLPFAKSTLRPPARPSGDPIEPIVGQMQTVVADLAGLQTDPPVQQVQREIVSSLDVLIQQLQKQCKGGGGANPNPSQPMSRSTLAKGPGGSGPLHDPHAGTRVWGQLPPKEREKILQSQTEGFPPGYEAVLANYYNRLAQEQVTAESTGAKAPEPTTRPGTR